MWRGKRTCRLADSTCPRGTHVPGPDTVIKQGKIRGQTSEGMLCSLSELGIGEDHEGIIELPLDAPVGTVLQVLLKQNMLG